MRETNQGGHERGLANFSWYWIPCWRHSLHQSLTRHGKPQSERKQDRTWPPDWPSHARRHKLRQHATHIPFHDGKCRSFHIEAVEMQMLVPGINQFLAHVNCILHTKFLLRRWHRGEERRPQTCRGPGMKLNITAGCSSRKQLMPHLDSCLVVLDLFHFRCKVSRDPSLAESSHLLETTIRSDDHDTYSMAIQKEEFFRAPTRAPFRSGGYDLEVGGGGGSRGFWHVALVYCSRLQLAAPLGGSPFAPFPWTLSLHRRLRPSASHHPVPFLFLPVLFSLLYVPFLSLGCCANRAPGLSLFHCSVSGPRGGKHNTARDGSKDQQF